MSMATTTQYTHPLPPSASELVVAVDGSPAAAEAVPFARAVAAQLGATLRLLRVAESQPPVESPRSSEHDVVSCDHDEHAHDGPKAAILEAIGHPKTILVVLTTHGGAVESAPRLGHLAEAVIARAQRPILLIRPEVAVADRMTSAPSEPYRLRRMLVPLDGTPTTAAALRPVLDLAHGLGAALDLLFVASRDHRESVEPGCIHIPPYVDDSQHAWPHWQREVVEWLRACCREHLPEVPMRVSVASAPTEPVGEAIVRFATEQREDAIVLVRRSRLESTRAPVMRTVLAQAPCPILVIGTP
ncbi:MAG: universal stress protein [Ktedonobacterales bacterium]|nr:universal stress protein [Ktedonobacterales bacterium]